MKRTCTHTYTHTHTHTHTTTSAQVLDTRPPHVQKAAIDFIDFLFTPGAQSEFGKLGFRVNPKISKQAAEQQVRLACRQAVLAAIQRAIPFRSWRLQVCAHVLKAGFDTSRCRGSSSAVQDVFFLLAMTIKLQ